jgi:hypothetical protein
MVLSTKNNTIVLFGNSLMEVCMFFILKCTRDFVNSKSQSERDFLITCGLPSLFNKSSNGLISFSQ